MLINLVYVELYTAIYTIAEMCIFLVHIMCNYHGQPLKKKLKNSAAT